jgi:heme-degrading monooxygenase HmoA
MIARIWRGTTMADRADEYLRYIEETGVAEYEATPGHRGTQILTRTRDGRTLITVISFWDSMDAVRGFAGDNPERAVYYPEDDRFLVERDDRASHYDLFEY